MLIYYLADNKQTATLCSCVYNHPDLGDGFLSSYGLLLNQVYSQIVSHHLSCLITYYKAFDLQKFGLFLHLLVG